MTLAAPGLLAHAEPGKTRPSFQRVRWKDCITCVPAARHFLFVEPIGLPLIHPSRSNAVRGRTRSKVARDRSRDSAASPRAAAGSAGCLSPTCSGTNGIQFSGTVVMMS